MSNQKRITKGQRVRSILNPCMTYRVIGGGHGYIHLVAETSRITASTLVPESLDCYDSSAAPRPMTRGCLLYEKDHTKRRTCHLHIR